MTICVLASALCVTAFAAEPSVVISIYGLKENGEKVGLNSYTTFAEGWEAAVDFANDHNMMDREGYTRIVVDFHADWKANKDGEFGDGGDGFEWSTIYVPGKTRITMNLNGHTIDRGLGENNELDGEVIWVNNKADLIINDGTITGGNSDTGAGGLYITNGSTVTLNNVNVIKNTADGDYGGGIGLHDGSTLIMKGGSISGNKNNSLTEYAAGVYLDSSTATFEGVTFSDNQNTYYASEGTVIYANDHSKVTMNQCEVIDNGTKNDALGTKGQVSLIVADWYSELTITETNFRGNGYAASEHSSASTNCLINISSHAHAYINKCTFTNNSAKYLIDSHNGSFEIANTSFLNNPANVFHGFAKYTGTFSDCVFNNNPASKWTDCCSFDFVYLDSRVEFIRCDFGNATFNDRSRATFADTVNPNGAGSIFSEGSPIMIVAIVAILALAASVVSIFMVANLKKKLVPAAVNNTKDEE